MIGWRASSVVEKMRVDGPIGFVSAVQPRNKIVFSQGSDPSARFIA